MPAQRKPKSPADIESDRAALIMEIAETIALHGTGDGDRKLDPKVLKVIGRVPREAFVPEMEQGDAYANRPLPIGHRQTISQPLIVALMTHHLRLSPEHRVLEIGTGSGYQTAVLAELVNEVISIENVDVLASEAKARLTDLGYQTIRFIEGDGREGCPENAPFDRIIVTAAAEAIPPALLDQLAPEGRLVLPLDGDDGQDLVIVDKDKAGRIKRRRLFPVRFVPLTFGHP